MRDRVQKIKIKRFRDRKRQSKGIREREKWKKHLKRKGQIPCGVS